MLGGFRDSSEPMLEYTNELCLCQTPSQLWLMDSDYGTDSGTWSNGTTFIVQIYEKGKNTTDRLEFRK